MKIYLARHGQDEDNLNGILNGHRNSPLTDLGVEQAKEVARMISEAGLLFDYVYSSPLQRAFKTAEIISKESNNPKPQKNKKLIERDFGIMTGSKTKDIKEACSPDIIETDVITYFLNPEGGETFPDSIEKVSLMLKELREQHNGQTILLVSHGDIGKMIYAAFYDLPWEKVLRQFHFGNSELLLLSEDSSPEESHVFSIKQYNH